jgi:signal transduction histidine kinase
MKRFEKTFTARYATALHRYLRCATELNLEDAYELGRKAINKGVGVLSMARIHQKALTDYGLHALSSDEHTQAWKESEVFLLEALSPFEATHRGFSEANLRLQELIKVFEKRNLELARINNELKIEVNERKKTEQALRENENRLRDLSDKILHIQEEERTRISRELHDDVGQALTAINVNLTLHRNNLGAPMEVLRAKVGETQSLVERAMEKMHRFAHELRPASLDDLGLLPALRSYVKEFVDRTGIDVRLKADVAAESLDPEGKTVVFRVVQESLTNVVKHAQASRVKLTVEKKREQIHLLVRDNGKAFSVQEKINGKNRRLGLLGMQERVRLVNGSFQITSKAGQGTSVHVQIPFTETETPPLKNHAKNHCTAR